MKKGNIVFFTGNEDYPNGDVGIVTDTRPNRAFWSVHMESFTFGDNPEYFLVGPQILGRW